MVAESDSMNERKTILTWGVAFTFDKAYTVKQKLANII